MTIQSTIPVLFPLKEAELSVQAVVTDGAINLVEVVVEGDTIPFNRDADGHFKNNGQNDLDPAYVAYIGRQLCRRFN